MAIKRLLRGAPTGQQKQTRAFIKAQQRRKGKAVEPIRAAGSGRHYQPKPKDFRDPKAALILRGYNRLTVNWCFGPGRDGNGGPGRLDTVAVRPSLADMPSFLAIAQGAVGLRNGREKAERLTIRELAAVTRTTPPTRLEIWKAVENQVCPRCGTLGMFTGDRGKCERSSCHFRY